MEKESYTKEDTECTHCHGKIKGHLAGETVMYWCDDCGSNNPSKKSNVELTFSK